MEFVDGVEGITGIELVDRVGRVLGIEAVDGIEQVVGQDNPERSGLAMRRGVEVPGNLSSGLRASRRRGGLLAQPPQIKLKASKSPQPASASPIKTVRKVRRRQSTGTSARK